MTLKQLAKTITIAILMTTLAQADPYSLDWDQIHTASDAPIQSESVKKMEAKKESVRREREKLEDARRVEVPKAAPAALMGTRGVASYQMRAPRVDYDPNAIVGAAPRVPASWDSNSPRNNAPVQRAALTRRCSPPELETFNVEVSAHHFFSPYHEGYVPVSSIVVASNRRGYSSCETFENVGQWQEYEIFINDLTEGDSFELEVTWTDGSSATYGRVMSRGSSETVTLFEPQILTCR